jgi:hypothetical protein
MLGNDRMYIANRKARKHLKFMHSVIGLDDFSEHEGIFRKTRVRCSCWMCRNRRALEGPPISEKRKLIDDTE